MFSATFKKKIERLARDVLMDPVRIIQGELGEANEDVTQIVLVMPAGSAKWLWLTSKLVELLSGMIYHCKELFCSNFKTLNCFYFNFNCTYAQEIVSLQLGQN